MAPGNCLRRSMVRLTGFYLCYFAVFPSFHGHSDYSEQSPFGNVVAINDAELDQQRGGMEMPNGMNLKIGIELSTRVNGDVVLRSVFSDAAAAGTQQVSVYTGGSVSGSGPVVAINGAAPFRVSNEAGGSGTSAGIRIEPTATGISVQPVASAAQGADLMSVPVSPDSAPVTTDFGAISVQRSVSGTTVSLAAPDLLIQHMAGAATGQFVANTSNNRTIDQSTVFNVEILNASPAIGSALMRVDAAAVASVRIPDF